MKKNLFIIMLITICWITFSNDLTDYDLFEEDLKEYGFYKDVGSTILFWGTVTLAAGFLCGSTFQTFESLEYIPTKTSSPVIMSSYITVGVSSIIAFVGFLVWKNNSDDYLKTLRLQFQYYNLTKE